MLTEPQRDRIEVVLVSPRNPLNIGAAARAMANFGFSRLAVVAPYEERWREAKSAVGAPELLQNAKAPAALSEAVADCTLVIGTGTLAQRKPEQPVVSLPELTPIVRREFARGGRVALVFGPEKRGLTREDLSYCHLLVEIPTAPRQPSMNLGQAVAVCLYELSARLNASVGNGSVTESHPSDKYKCVARVGHPAPVSRLTFLRQEKSGNEVFAESHPSGSVLAAASGELERLAGVVEKTMLAANYSPAAMRKANRHDLRLLLRRLALTGQDARRILGLFRQILWRLKQ